MIQTTRQVSSPAPGSCGIRTQTLILRLLLPQKEGKVSVASPPSPLTQLPRTKATSAQMCAYRELDGLHDLK